MDNVEPNTCSYPPDEFHDAVEDLDLERSVVAPLPCTSIEQPCDLSTTDGGFLTPLPCTAANQSCDLNTTDQGFVTPLSFISTSQSFNLDTDQGPVASLPCTCTSTNEFCDLDAEQGFVTPVPCTSTEQTCDLSTERSCAALCTSTNKPCDLDTRRCDSPCTSAYQPGDNSTGSIAVGLDGQDLPESQALTGLLAMAKHLESISNEIGKLSSAVAIDEQPQGPGTTAFSSNPAIDSLNLGASNRSKSPERSTSLGDVASSLLVVKTERTSIDDEISKLAVKMENNKQTLVLNTTELVTDLENREFTAIVNIDTAKSNDDFRDISATSDNNRETLVAGLDSKTLIADNTNTNQSTADLDSKITSRLDNCELSTDETVNHTHPPITQFCDIPDLPSSPTSQQSTASNEEKSVKDVKEGQRPTEENSAQKEPQVAKEEEEEAVERPSNFRKLALMLKLQTEMAKMQLAMSKMQDSMRAANAALREVMDDAYED